MAASQSLNHLLHLKVDPQIGQWRRHYDSADLWRRLSSNAISAILASQPLDNQVVLNTPAPMEVDVNQLDGISLDSRQLGWPR